MENGLSKTEFLIEDGHAGYSEAERDHAANGLDYIDSLPNRLHMLLIAGAHKYDLHITKTQGSELVSLFRETLEDVLSKERERLITIKGVEDLGAPQDAIEMLTEALKPNGVGHVA